MTTLGPSSNVLKVRLILTPVTFLLLSDALSTVKLQQSATVTSLLDQANLDGLKFLVVFKTDQVSALLVTELKYSPTYFPG